MVINNNFQGLCQLGQVYSYYDTLGMFYERSYPYEIIRRLKGYGNRIICRKFNYGTWVQVQQPNNEILYILSNSEEQGKLTSLDIAIDIESIDPLKLASYLKSNLKQKYKRKNHRRRHIGDTTYFREKRKVNRNIVIYGDKPSKVTGHDCAHIELRVKGAAAINGLKLTIRKLIEGVDVLALLNRFCRLENNVENELKSIILVDF